MASEETVVKRARAALEREPRINLHRYPIQMNFSEGVVTLEGDVEDIAAKKLALELAASIPEVTGVVDRLRVSRPLAAGDGAVRDHVRDALLQEPALESCAIRVLVKERMMAVREPPEAVGAIEVEVKDAVVTLNGQVPSLSHKRLAGVLAWWVPQTRDVVNGLEVTPEQEDSDDELTDAVRLVLEKDPFVEAGQIRVSTRKRVVTLEGLAANESIKRIADLDVWYVFGVDRVINRLEVPA